MGLIQQERPDLAAKGWTQEMWDARNALSPLQKAFSTDDSFAADWASGNTEWQKYMAEHPGMDYRTGRPYTPGATSHGLTGSMSDAEGNPLPAEALPANTPGAQLDTSMQDAERGRTQQLLAQLQQQAATGGGEWEQTFKDATQRASATAQSLGTSARGVDYGSKLRNIGNAQGAVQQQSVGQEEILRNKQKQLATGQVADLLAGMGAQDVDQSAAVAGVRQDVRAANVAQQESARKNVLNQAGGIAQGITSSMSAGGKVPGQAEVFGDDERNDTVPARLSPGEIVIPRSIAQRPDAAEGAAMFVAALKARSGNGGDGGKGGSENFAEGGQAPWQPGDLDPTSQDMGAGGKPQRKKSVLGFNGQAPSIDNGALLDTGQFNQSRGQNLANDKLFAQQIYGMGPTVVPAMMQQATDRNITEALQASANQHGQGGAATAGNTAMLASQAAQNAAVQGAEMAGGEQQAAQQAFARSLLAQRERDAAMAKAQQRALLRNSMLNAGISLQDQAILQNIAAGASQGVSAIAAAGRSKGSGADPSRVSADEMGERGGYTDLSASDPDFKAYGGEIGSSDADFARSIQGFAGGGITGDFGTPYTSAVTGAFGVPTVASPMAAMPLSAFSLPPAGAAPLAISPPAPGRSFSGAELGLGGGFGPEAEMELQLPQGGPKQSGVATPLMAKEAARYGLPAAQSMQNAPPEEVVNTLVQKGTTPDGLPIVEPLEGVVQKPIQGLRLKPKPADAAAAPGTGGSGAPRLGGGMKLPGEADYSQANREALAAGQEQMQAEVESAKAKAQGLVEQQKVLERAQLERNQAQVAAKQQVSEAMSRVQRAQDEVSRIDTSVDPGRFWASRSTGDRVLGIIGLALGSIGAGNDGVNRAAGMMQQAIDRDIDAQKAETEFRMRKGQAGVEAAKSFYSMARQASEDDLAATDIARGMALQAAANKAEQLAASTAGGQAKANLSKLAADLSMQATTRKQSAQQTMFDNRLKAAHLANEAAQVAASMAKKEGLPPDQLKTVTEVRERAGNIRSSLDQADAIIQKWGTFELTGSEQAKLNKALSDVATDMAKLKDPASAARESEVESELGNLGFKAGSLTTSNATARELLKNYRAAVDRREQEAFRVRGLPPPGAQ